MKMNEIFKNERKVLVAYLTAGDPNLSKTATYLKALVDGGADLLEVGVPFSDPVADGPVIQRAMERALKSQTTLEKVLALLKKLKLKVPVVIFSYYNPILKMGVERFAQVAKDAGVSGCLIVDCPFEEAQDIQVTLEKCDIEMIWLASPTTSNARLTEIAKRSRSFVYYVSRAGVTGAQKKLSADLKSDTERLRRFMNKPFVIGFGISDAKQAGQAAQLSDGVVVGSAIVQLIEKNKSAEKPILKFTQSLRKALG